MPERSGTWGASFSNLPPQINTPRGCHPVTHRVCHLFKKVPLHWGSRSHRVCHLFKEVIGFISTIRLFGSCNSSRFCKLASGTTSEIRLSQSLNAIRFLRLARGAMSMIWLFSKSRNFNFNRFERDINREPNFHKTRTLRFIAVPSQLRSLFDHSRLSIPSIFSYLVV